MALLLPADSDACLSFHGRYGRDLFLKSQALCLKRQAYGFCHVASLHGSYGTEVSPMVAIH